MKLKDLLVESSKDVIGPFKVASYDAETRIMRLKGYRDITLDPSITDKPTVGYNQSFILKDENTASDLVNQTADLIVYTDEEVLLIKRGNEPFKGKWASPGGFIDPGETPMEAARRELKEETGVTMNGSLTFVGLFNEPNRDPRVKNVWSYVYSIKIEKPVAAEGQDDAKDAKWIPIKDVFKLDIAFDHKDMLAKVFK